MNFVTCRIRSSPCKLPPRQAIPENIIRKNKKFTWGFILEILSLSKINEKQTPHTQGLREKTKKKDTKKKIKKLNKIKLEERIRKSQVSLL